MFYTHNVLRALGIPPKEDPYANAVSDPLAPPVPQQVPAPPEATAFAQQPPEEKGMLQRMQETPGFGLGLMQLGAGLAAGKNWGEGIGMGFSNMATTMQKQQELEANNVYKQQMLLAKAMGKGKGSVNDIYSFTLEDGRTVDGQYITDDAGNSVPADLYGRPLQRVVGAEVKGTSGGSSSQRVSDKIYIGTDKNGNPVRARLVAGRDGNSHYTHADTGEILDGVSGMKEEVEAPQPGTPPRPQAVTVRAPDGTPIAETQQMWDPASRKFVVTHPKINGGKATDINELYSQGYEIQQSTASERTKQMFSLKDAAGYFDTAQGAEIAVHALNRFRDKVINSPDGARNFFTKLNAEIQTVFGEGANISEVSKAIMERDGRAESIVGMLRKEVVGGGTMTEQDALRVLAAIGGSPGAWNWNREVALSMLDDLLATKNLTYSDSVRWYNEAMQSLNRPERWVSRLSGAQGSVNDSGTITGAAGGRGVAGTATDGNGKPKFMGFE